MNRQRGVALVTILLVVAIATVLGVAMARDQNRVIQRARNFFDVGQARVYALGGEELARQILYEDLDGQPAKDSLADAWAASDLRFEFAEGEVVLRIEDLQGRFNVNSLSDPGETGRLARDRFTLLLNRTGIDLAVLDRIADWVDQDLSVRRLGAEDYEYLGRDLPYRTSGQLMVDTSELRLIMDQASWLAIEPWVTALPDVEVPINVNTAPPAVLQTLSAELGADGAEQLARSRDEQQGFDSLADFLRAPEIAGLGIPARGLGVQSVFFQVQVTARYQQRLVYLTSILERDPVNGEMRVIYRNFGRKIPSVQPGDTNVSRAGNDV